MAAADDRFREGSLSTPIRDLGLDIAGTALEPIVAEFRGEVERAGIRRVVPQFYLSDEWGVNLGTIAIGIPFYLARPELTALHEERTGFVEGADRAELLRYLRHEMGHVVNYAYELYEREDWVEQFGPMTRPYLEDYRPQPFSRRFVRHLPGWYAQKHPDEDWAETFAVWMTPGSDWRKAFAGWPGALAKLEYCDRTMAELAGQEPLVTAAERDQDVADLAVSVEQFYAESASGEEDFPPGLDGALQTIFETEDAAGDGAARKLPAAQLIRKVERELVANVYRWTGQFPERTRPLVRHLAARAEALHQVYAAEAERAAVTALTTLVTALAMNQVLRGSYSP